MSAGKPQTSAAAPARRARRFRLPPDAPVQAVNQTLIQMDVPPEIRLKQELPLPTVLLWSQTKLPPLRRQFVAPPDKKAPAVTQSLPQAIALQAPNLQPDVAKLSIAAATADNTPSLLPPPSVAPPVSVSASEPAKEIPAIGLAKSDQPSQAAVLSLANQPPRSSTVVLPPANQAAAADRADAGSLQGDRGAPGPGSAAASPSVARATSQSGNGNAKAGSGPSQDKDSKSGAAAKTPAAVNAAAKSGNPEAPAQAKSAAETGSSKSSTAEARATSPSDAASKLNAGAEAAESTSAPEDNLAGATRFSQPRDGNFGVVVLGSSEAARYPASVGILSGKIVYTVYLHLGLRKSWILQYCIPSNAQPNIAGSGAPVGAPWPFEIMRPDRWSASDPDYIVVHGTLDATGRFDQLAMVFPAALETKDLILNSLRRWAFRPATRDGVPTPVEVLLIIPREA